MIFDMRKDKILFVFERCEYNNNKNLASENLLFLSIILFVIIIRSLTFIIINKLNENNFDIDFSKNKKKININF